MTNQLTLAVRLAALFVVAGFSSHANANSPAPAATLPRSENVAAPRASCPPAAGDIQVNPALAEKHERAAIIFGSDVLGRIAIAADYNGDDFADEVMLYWEKSRRTDVPVRKLRSATIVLLDGVLMVQSPGGSTEAVFSISGRDLSLLKGDVKRGRRTIIADRGLGFARIGIDPSAARPMYAFDHSSLYTWPEGFREDTQFQQQTHGGGQCPSCPNANNYNCQGGGCGTTTCNIPCGGACSVSCMSGHFACCNCPGGNPGGVCSPLCHGCQDVPP